MFLLTKESCFRDDECDECINVMMNVSEFNHVSGFFWLDESHEFVNECKSLGIFWVWKFWVFWF